METGRQGAELHQISMAPYSPDPGGSKILVAPPHHGPRRCPLPTTILVAWASRERYLPQVLAWALGRSRLWQLARQGKGRDERTDHGPHLASSTTVPSPWQLFPIPHLDDDATSPTSMTTARSMEAAPPVDAGPTGFPNDMTTSHGPWPSLQTRARRGITSTTPNLSRIG
jgi:hypothetical protein